MNFRASRAQSIHLLALSLGLPFYNNFDSAESWCMSRLSRDHLDHRADLAKVLISGAELLSDDQSIEDLPTIVDTNGPWYRSFEAAILRVAEASKLGVPFDLHAAEALREECHATMLATAQELCHYPDFLIHEEQLRASGALGPEVSNTVLQHVSTETIALDGNPSGQARVSREALVLAGCTALPFWSAWSRNNDARHLSAATSRYERFASAGRLHPMVTWSAAAGRTAAREPSVQNMPGESRFRALVRARPGYSIVSLDFAAVELRIGAVLGIRAACDINRIRRGSFQPREQARLEWLLPSLRDISVEPDEAVNSSLPGDLAHESVSAVRNTLRKLAHRVVYGEQFVMARIFRQGLDPHLVTALDMARHTRKIAFNGSALDWLASQTCSEQKLLKQVFADDRQAAKACNFGLLYGMSAKGLHRLGRVSYGLNWTLDEAGSARSAWLDLYPDLHLWQVWTRYFRRQWMPHKMSLFKSRRTQYDSDGGDSTALYQVSTLTNRRTQIIDDNGAALSYQNQGTGADILARSIAALPKEVTNRFILPVHDELVFEVPHDEAEDLARLAEGAMIDAAGDVLKNRVPVSVEVRVGDSWAA